MSVPWLTATVSFGLRSAYQRGTSAVGISMKGPPLRGCCAPLVVAAKRDSERRARPPTKEVVAEEIRGVHIAGYRTRVKSSSYYISEIEDNPAAPENVIVRAV